MFKKNLIIFLTDIMAFMSFAAKRISAFLGVNRNVGKLRILVYHSVSNKAFAKDLFENNVSLDSFRWQMSMLKNLNRVVGLTEGLKDLQNGILSCPSVAICFDDGMACVYNEALEVLQDSQVPATFFITYGYTDSCKEGFMDWSMVLSLKEKGYEIGSHSYSHRRLSALNDEELDKETLYTKKKFEEKGIPTEYFSYPYGFYGDFSEETEEKIKRSGYKASFTNIMGDNAAGDDAFGLRRTRVSWRDTPFRFRMKIEGAYDWVDALKYRLSLAKKEKGFNYIKNDKENN